MSRHRLRIWDVLLREEAQARGLSEHDTRTRRARGRARSTVRSTLMRLRRTGVKPQAWPRLVCLAILRVSPELSNREIAALAKLSHPTVAVLRQKFTTHEDDATPAKTHETEHHFAEIPDDKCEDTSMELIELRRVRMNRRPRSKTTDFLVAVYGSTPANPQTHYLGDKSVLDVDRLFKDGRAWGITERREAVARHALVIQFPQLVETREAA